ncbi:MAG TPA: toprim domain-containing protein, partial [Polyangia bacterium]
MAVSKKVKEEGETKASTKVATAKPARAKKPPKTAPQDEKPAVKPARAAKPAKAPKVKKPAPEEELPSDDADEPSDEPSTGKSKRRGTLVVVESPAKAATIKKYLGAGFVVKASVGHVKDLPKATMGIDVEHDFQPEYVVIEGKKKVIADIK